MYVIYILYRLKLQLDQLMNFILVKYKILNDYVVQIPVTNT